MYQSIATKAEAIALEHIQSLLAAHSSHMRGLEATMVLLAVTQPRSISQR